ncbi:MAG: rRNA adenine N-6-methyltransferase family protein [Pseudomonadota bacterium]|nr:rRNA adenine N-6-methyltransferase family protein [Pseudomonadota bacterium]
MLNSFKKNLTERNQVLIMIDKIKAHAKSHHINISPTILNIMKEIPRKHFGGTIDDSAHPIGYGQTISQPFMVALMTHLLLQYTPQLNQALEIGTGSGYQAAILARLFKKVTSIERIQALYHEARKRLHTFKNIQIIHADGKHIPHNHDSIDAIIVTCGIQGSLPSSWINWLNPQGIIVVPHSTHLEDSMRIRLYKNINGCIVEVPYNNQPIHCRFVPFVPGRN